MLYLMSQYSCRNCNAKLRIDIYTSEMAEIQRLVSSCYVASNISDGDVLPIGGSIINNTVSRRIRADFAVLQHLFLKVEHTFAANDMNSLKQYAESLGTKANPEIFASLFLLQKYLEKALWPKTRQDPNQRQQFYKAERETPLSKLVAEAQMACVELSLFTAKVLQDRGVKVKLITGAFVGRKIGPDDDEYSEPHTYLAIEDKATDHTLIYDPANPVNTNHGQCPSVFVIQGEIFARWLERAKITATYLEVTEELSGNTKYYGASPAMLDFNPERDIFRNNVQHGVQHAEALQKMDNSQIKPT